MSTAVVREGRGVEPAPSTALAAAIEELESVSRFERAGIEERAEQAVATAHELGLTELELRARLVLVDLLRRRGDVAEAGRRAHELQRWATDHDASHLLARSHFVLAAVFQELGDLSVALGHAVRSVELLADDVRAQTRIDHHARLADCLGLSGDTGARERYDLVLRLAQDIGDVDRQLLVLNNRAYCETLIGAFDEALLWSTTLQSLSAEHGVALDVGRLDTIGRALLELGRLADAEAAMLPGLHPAVLGASQDGDAGADFLLTLAEIQRRSGRTDDAQSTIRECVLRCERHGLTAIRVRVRREQSELYAARGEFQAAYEEHKLYADEQTDLQSAERDARARALHAMYETTEARQQSRRYRELSLRDPLTGLYNRRFVDDQLPRLLAAGDSGPVTVALLDLDHFKRINDTCSHETGDRVLRAVADLLLAAESIASAGSGAGSFAARMGGEEFLLVLVGHAVPAAARQLEELRLAIGSQPWAELTGDLPVTVSIGAASTDGPVPATPAELLGNADARLYRAKRQGRDQVVAGS